MTDFEKLGVFYLGKLYDMASRTRQEDLLLYDAKDLTTHAVCVGMTGSGKTGLCLSLLEEAAIDGIPAILIDPKGDLANLMLTFPGLTAAEFAPWVNPAEAETKGMSVTDFAATQAELWRKGLADWGQDGARIQRLRDAVEVAIYTPGSNAGLPVSVLNSFAAPDIATRNDEEALHDRIATTVASLLSLVGIEADPIQSREFILLATILDRAWRAGQNVDLAALIQQVQEPPVTTVGILDLETFYPAKERFRLVMALNNLLASPGFQAWLSGEALDINRMLYGATGKPRIAIFSIAHLSDAERMFFVALLLNQIVGWVRTLSGTTSLRALVYMDEIFGYFPPTANPPSKQPLLTLLKQARAFGVGVMLATQNPVDLDYKGLANCGTWFIGRLQAERDKLRLLDGLESVNAGAGQGFDRQAIDATLSSLGSRVFLLNNVHEDAPAIFQTRWALSYLRGPLTQEHIRTLMAPFKSSASQSVPDGVTAPTSPAAPSTISSTVPSAATPLAQSTPIASASTAAAPAAPVAPSLPEGLSRTPALAQDVPTYFIPVRGRAGENALLVYEPLLLGVAALRFNNDKMRISDERKSVRLATIKASAVPVDWAEAEVVELSAEDLEKSGAEGGLYRELPPAAGKSKSYTAWGRELIDWLYGSEQLSLYKAVSLDVTSQPGEAERDFRIRLSQVAREQRDGAVEKIRAKYNSERERLEERIRKAEQTKAREQEQASSATLQSVISLGSTVLGAFLGRKKLSSSTISKATTAARGIGRAYGQGQDVARANENIDVLKKELEALNTRFMDETKQLETAYDPLNVLLDTITLKPYKKDISVQLLALVWAPHWQDNLGNSQSAWS
jgi:hypothetical protein